MSPLTPYTRATMYAGAAAFLAGAIVGVLAQLLEEVRRSHLDDRAQLRAAGAQLDEIEAEHAAELQRWQGAYHDVHTERVEAERLLAELSPPAAAAAAIAAGPWPPVEPDETQAGTPEPCTGSCDCPPDCAGRQVDAPATEEAAPCPEQLPAPDELVGPNIRPDTRLYGPEPRADVGELGAGD